MSSKVMKPYYRSSFSCILLLLSLLSVLFTVSNANASDVITAHVIPHSHCDPGWLSTFEQYYNQDVRLILTNVVEELLRDSTKTFIWSETSFFNLWYETVPRSKRAQFRELVNSGRFEFVGGGWSQHDEATPDPMSVVNQLTQGHDYLLKNFGVHPRIAWQIDPFGHSAVTPSLFALMGYDGLVINRIHHNIKQKFKNTRSMEFIWRGADVGDVSASDMFTHVLHSHYSAVSGFDWEERAQPVSPANVEQRTVQYCNAVKDRAKAYRTPHVLVPFGDDFKFKNAALQFRNMDQIVKFAKENPTKAGCNIVYSTPYRYFQAVRVHPAASFGVVTGDFYPYADNQDSYWTGFYTTRPFLKQLSRDVTHQMRSTDILHSLMRGAPNNDRDTEMKPVTLPYWENFFKLIEDARHMSGLFMHHDAITGTARDAVVRDYQAKMSRASTNMFAISESLLAHVMTREPSPPPTFSVIPFMLALANSAATVFPITVYNPLAWERDELITLLVKSGRARVFDPQGHAVLAQLDPDWSTGEPNIVGLPDRFKLRFVANRLPPLGAATYFIEVLANEDPVVLGEAVKATTWIFMGAGSGANGGTQASTMSAQGAVSNIASVANRFMSTVANWGGQASSSPTASTFSSGAAAGTDAAKKRERLFSTATLEGQPGDIIRRPLPPTNTGKEISIENDLVRASFDTVDGTLAHVTNKIGKEECSQSLQQRFGVYRTSRSGAYLFRPQGHATYTLNRRALSIRVMKGPVVSTVVTHLPKHVVESRLVVTQAPGASAYGVPEAASPEDIGSPRDRKLRGSLDFSVSSTAGPNEEIVMGFTPSMNSPLAMSTHNGLSFGERTFNPAPIPMQSNFYPSVAGVRVSKLAGSANVKTSSGEPPRCEQVTIFTAHTMAVGQPKSGDLELMIHRHLSQDDGRGLAQAVVDASLLTAHFRLDVGPSEVADPLAVPAGSTPTLDAHTPATMLGSSIASLNYPLMVMFPDKGIPSLHDHLGINTNSVTTAPAAAAASDKEGKTWTPPFLAGLGLQVPAVRAYVRQRHTRYRPLKRAFPPAYHLESLLTRDSITDDTVLRVRGLDPRAPAWSPDISKLFFSTPTATPLKKKQRQSKAGDSKALVSLEAEVGFDDDDHNNGFRTFITELRPAALSLNLMLKPKHKYPERMRFRYSDAAQEKLFEAAASAAAQESSGRQNSAEEGVYISQAALDKLAADNSKASFLEVETTIAPVQTVQVRVQAQEQEQTPELRYGSSAIAIPDTANSTSSAHFGRKLLQTVMSGSPIASDSMLGSLIHPLSSASRVSIRGTELLTYVFRIVTAPLAPGELAKRQAKEAKLLTLRKKYQDEQYELAKQQQAMLEELHRKREAEKQKQQKESGVAQQQQLHQQQQQQQQQLPQQPSPTPTTTAAAAAAAAAGAGATAAGATAAGATAAGATAPATVPEKVVPAVAPDEVPWWLRANGAAADKQTSKDDFVAVLATSLPRAPHAPHGPHNHEGGQTWHPDGTGSTHLRTHVVIPGHARLALSNQYEFVAVMFAMLVVLLYFLYKLNLRVARNTVVMTNRFKRFPTPLGSGSSTAPLVGTSSSAGHQFVSPNSARGSTYSIHHTGGKTL